MREYIIYPKQFRNEPISVERNRCFFLMPFSKNFDYIYGIIKRELHEAGLVCNRADEITGSKPILNKILTEILKSQYIIADLTGYNPNVFYELGIAHTFKDAHDILLIKQRESKIPFDLSHLTYIEYDPDNPKLLVSTILRFIDENKPITALYDILNLRGLINGIDANQNDFVEYLHDNLNSELTIIGNLLNHQTEDIKENDIERVLNKYQVVICNLLRKKNIDILPKILKTYYAIIVSSAAYTIVDEFIQHFLGNFFINLDVSTEELLTWQTDLILALATHEKKLTIVLPWIIGYFKRSKSATIDLNRYKVESFLMTTASPEIEKAIENAIFDDNCYVREHLSDIIGEKKLFSAKNKLYKQLTAEDNFFTAASIISAIGKLEDEEGILVINRWIEDHKKEILETKQFFVLRRALMAITKLDNSFSQDKINAFNENYGEIIKGYYII